jgi:two-component system cell cycle response regulator
MIELKSWYRERLLSRIVALEEVRERLKTRKPESIEAVRRIAHSLQGSGGTYGFPEITESARLLEDADDRDLLSRLEALIKTLGSVHAGGSTPPISILVVEDDEDQSRYVADALSAPTREILEARTAEEAQAILEDRAVSLILLDLILPDIDGRVFLSRLRGCIATAQVPVIVLTVKSAAQARAECFALGADDFIQKPVKAETLKEIVAARLLLGSGIARELSRDPITGLPNRAAFYELFKRMRSGIASSRQPASAAILALDGFETVLKEFGPKTADAVLRHAAGVLTRIFRTSDVLSRYGGSEFAALFPNTEPDGAAIALGKALQAMKESPFPMGKEHPLHLGFSAGLAPVLPGKILNDVLAEAERHLHQARESGGGRTLSAQDTFVPPRRKILIADDDELIRMLLQRILEREGYETLLFPNGRAALKGAAGNPVSMVISDVSMPLMDGFELVSRLRSLPDYSSVPIVMLTSMGSEEDVVRGFELGADEYILKPFSSAEFLARIRRLLRRAPSSAGRS